MKSSLNFLFICLFALMFQGCVASSPSGKRKTSTSNSSTGSKATPTSPTFSSDENLYWFTSEKITGTITLNKTFENVVYIRGKTIHDFLNSKDTSGILYYQTGKPFCIVGNFPAPFKQVRLRALAISVSNYSTQTVERLLRVDVPSATENQSTCGVATVIDGSTAATIDSKTNANAAYSFSQVCNPASGCTVSGFATTTTTSAVMGLKLYESTLNTNPKKLDLVPVNKITLSNLNLRIDLQSTSTGPVSSCTNSSCSAKGFDCCIEGQCVKDAATKPNASTNYPTEYLQATADFAVNPLSFLNYPNIYYICTNISHTPPPVVTPGTTPQSEAEKRVIQYNSDYNCVKQFLSVGENTFYSHKQNNTILTSAPPAADVALYNYITCNAAYYKETKKRLAINCGCPSTYTDEERELKCPDWGVRPIYKSTVEIPSNIVDFLCYTPLPENPIGPITNLNVTVPNRSAPHRLYPKSAVDKTQEGEAFYYQDNIGKTSPFNGSFNINSILGSMTADLSQTNPAKKVDVELGKTYILSSISGYFTPCSNCAKDSWFQTFTAHPATTAGSGLRATGFSTSRDTYSNNTTFGNYEDTHFGRACYLPVTMIPFSHKKNGTLEDQRRNRLKTQAAYFINGYQKDWFGFNKGALIGSFDGVNWFAIGSGRRVTATSNKLFLALNGAFLDLVSKTDTIVNIIPDFSASVAADFDFDNEIAINDPKQNTAGSCQQYHQCATDADCISQLGWEYTCADVSQLRTKWPVFSSEADELKNQESSGSIFELLSNTTSQGNSSMRCVYRGSGAPCVKNIVAINNNINQKALTCAPNFYCAGLEVNKYNEEVARSPNEFDDMLFGMDANVLGRPLKYISATKPLPSEVQTNILYNAGAGGIGLSAALVNEMGICRPGRSLAAINPEDAHYREDNLKRTDYISQIGSCDSTINNSAINRTIACPAIGEDLNYVPLDMALVDSTFGISQDVLKTMQNSCGAEAKNPNPITIDKASAFSLIEGKALRFNPKLTQPTLAADACLRRAGSICHTDLDCGPNKMHEEQALTLNTIFFGKTDAEKSYWSESLVCGQGTPVPQLGSANYYTYKLSDNRCCREIGKDFTMFTSGPASFIPDNMVTNAALDTAKFAADNPTADYRYSRYSISKEAQSDINKIPKINVVGVSTPVQPEPEQWKVINETGSKTCCGGGWIRKFADGTHDWKIKNRLNIDTSNFSCLNFRSPLPDPTYSSYSSDFVNQVSYQREYDKFCKAPGQNGCFQIPFILDDIVGYSITPPKLYDPSDAVTADTTFSVGGWENTPLYQDASNNYSPYTSLPQTGYTRLDTAPVGELVCGYHYYGLNADVPYQPFLFSFAPALLNLWTCDTPAKEQRNLGYFIDRATYYGVSLYVPAYIPHNPSAVPTAVNPTLDLPTVKAIYIKYVYEDGRVEVVNITNRRETSAALCNDVTDAPVGSTKPPVMRMFAATATATEKLYEKWCVSLNAKTQNRPVIHVKAFNGDSDTDGTDPLRDWKYASVVIDFKPIEKQRGTKVTIPGNPYYYLTKLGRLELLGIPQITYDPIYCNNDQDKLVPGIFSTSASAPLTTRAQFESSTSVGTYDVLKLINYDDEGGSLADSTPGYGNEARKFTFQNKIAHPSIFSSKDFTCCTPLGRETSAPAKCCSGAAGTTNGKQYCKLPRGVDLNVYFNKFVSSEGVGVDEPAGGLIVTPTAEADSDFNDYTGEPKLRSSTYQKLEALGKKYCVSGVVGNGGSFGFFPPEPYSGYITVNGQQIVNPLSIVDSINDADGDLAGKIPFESGYRWDHHVYCK